MIDYGGKVADERFSNGGTTQPKNRKLIIYRTFDYTQADIDAYEESVTTEYRGRKCAIKGGETETALSYHEFDSFMAWLISMNVRHLWGQSLDKEPKPSSLSGSCSKISF